jgi:hypothetical protein
MSAMISRNLFLALLLSFILTFVMALVYTFFPLLSAMLSGIFNRQGTGGIAIVGGGLSGSSFSILLFIEVIFFLIIFALLQWKRSNYR